MMKFALAPMVLLLFAALPAQACFTGLTLIPTADTVGHGQYAIEFQLDGPIATPSVDTHILNTQFGIGDRCEVGLDFDLTEDSSAHFLLNAKYLLTGAGNKARTAVGVFDVCDHNKPSPYLVHSRDFATIRGHLGILRVDNTTRWFSGIDYAVTEKLTLMADFISGGDSFSAFGVSCQFNERRGLLVGIEFPNDGSDALFTAHLVFSGPLRK